MANAAGILTLFFALCFVVAVDSLVGTDDTLPDVAIFVLDDVAAADIDEVATPQFDLLAASGLSFDRAYASSVCSPSRRQLMLGRWWDRNSGSPCVAPQPGGRMPLGNTTLPELFKAEGYATALFGKWHLGSVEGVPWELSAQSHGFDHWDGISSNVGACVSQGGGYTKWMRTNDGVVTLETTYQTHAVRDAAIQWFAEEGGPKMAVICMNAPHLPLHYPPGVPSFPPLTKRGQYDAALKEVDAALGAICGALDSNAIVVVIGDNGTPAQVAPLAFRQKAKGTTYERGVRVPMVWKGPGIAQGSTSSLATIADLMPTFAELLGHEIDGPIDGVSLSAQLSTPGAPSLHQWVFVANFNSAQSIDDAAVISADYKYREFNGAPFLFELAADPDESANLAGDPDLEVLQASMALVLEEARPF